MVLFRKSPIVSKRRRVPLGQMKVPKKHTQSKKADSFTRSKNNKKKTLKIRESNFLYRELQKTKKIKKIGSSHRAEKK